MRKNLNRSRVVKEAFIREARVEVLTWAHNKSSH